MKIQGFQVWFYLFSGNFSQNILLRLSGLPRHDLYSKTKHTAVLNKLLSWDFLGANPYLVIIAVN